MKWSDNSCSACSTRSISVLSMTSTVVAVIAVGVPMRIACPAMQPSPKNSPVPNIATTASLPEPFTTDNFTPPFCTYITLSASSPCEKIASLRRNTETLRATPVVSRYAWGSNGFFILGFFIFIDNGRRYTPYTSQVVYQWQRWHYCSKLHSFDFLQKSPLFVASRVFKTERRHCSPPFCFR